MIITCRPTPVMPKVVTVAGIAGLMISSAGCKSDYTGPTRAEPERVYPPPLVVEVPSGTDQKPTPYPACEAANRILELGLFKLVDVRADSGAGQSNPANRFFASAMSRQVNPPIIFTLQKYEGSETPADHRVHWIDTFPETRSLRHNCAAVKLSQPANRKIAESVRDYHNELR